MTVEGCRSHSPAGTLLRVAFPEELTAAFPSYGPDWDRAVQLGIDVSLLLENLALTPEQRLDRLERLVRETDELRAAVQVADPAPESVTTRPGA